MSDEFGIKADKAWHGDYLAHWQSAGYVGVTRTVRHTDHLTLHVGDEHGSGEVILNGAGVLALMRFLRENYDEAELRKDWCTEEETAATEARKCGAPDAKGTPVQCAACGRRKAPMGRSAPEELGLCEYGCPGYECQPLPGDLWPNETREEFGYPCNTATELAGVGPVYLEKDSAVEVMRVYDKAILLAEKANA